MYSKELIQKIHQTLPSELLEPIASENTFDAVAQIAEQNNLSVEQMNKLSRIITYRLMAVIGENDLLKNIQGLEVDKNLSYIIESGIKEKILKNIPQEILEEQEQVTRKILNSSREISLEKPVGLPMVEPGEVAHEVPHVEMPNQEAGIKNQGVTQEVSMEKAEAAPTSQPTEPLKPEVKSSANHYPGGKDPYREPIE